MDNFPDGIDGPDAPWNLQDAEKKEYSVTLKVVVYVHGEDRQSAIEAAQDYLERGFMADMEVLDVEEL